MPRVFVNFLFLAAGFVASLSFRMLYTHDGEVKSPPAPTVVEAPQPPQILALSKAWAQVGGRQLKEGELVLESGGKTFHLENYDFVDPARKQVDPRACVVSDEVTPGNWFLDAEDEDGRLVRVKVTLRK